MPNPAIDMTGMTFGRLTVVRRLPENTRGGNARWECECECGATTIVPAGRLRRGQTRSCGCLQAETRLSAATVHGGARTTEYRSWCAMKQRCMNPNAAGYANYGGRGIVVCDQWLASFDAFYDEVGPKPSPDHSIDRIDNDGNYEPGNVRWATPAEQRRNQRPGHRKVDSCAS